MQPRDELPSDSKCLRHATPRQVTTPLPAAAFFLRADEPELSFGWLEYFAEYPSYEERLKRVCFTQSFRPNATGRVLCVDVDAARAALASIAELNDVRILWTPIVDSPEQSDDPCHASGVGIARLSEQFQQAAAEQFALAVLKNHEWRELYRLGCAPRTW